jgi:hypothetical protein
MFSIICVAIGSKIESVLANNFFIEKSCPNSYQISNHELVCFMHIEQHQKIGSRSLLFVDHLLSERLGSRLRVCLPQFEDVGAFLELRNLA